MIGDKLTVTEADVDGGFGGASVEAAETLWACLPQVRKWTSLATHEKALVIHTLARHRTNTTTELVEALRLALRVIDDDPAIDDWDEAVERARKSLTLHDRALEK